MLPAGASQSFAVQAGRRAEALARSVPAAGLLRRRVAGPLCLSVSLAALLGPLAGIAAARHHRITAPPKPARVVLGSSLAGTPINPFGRTLDDFESVPYFRYAYFEAYGGHSYPPPQSVGEVQQLLDPFASAAARHSRFQFPLVPVTGLIKSFTVKGATHLSNVPGPHGYGDIRLGIDQPLANGRLKVISTSNPSAELPRKVGVYTFRIGPPYTGFAMLVRKGDVISLDSPGGSYSLWARQPGAEMETVLGHGGSEQSPGVVWTGKAHPNLELLMRVTIQPTVRTARLAAAHAGLQAALADEQRALGGGHSASAARLRTASGLLNSLIATIRLARTEGEVSAATAATLDFDLDGAVARAGAAAAHGAAAPVAAALRATQTALGDVVTARELAKRVP